ncbi:YehS family protein [Pseudofulvibacter geojedonensis]|uniref:DUF1456 family protein n=1 Tax=Pseudofulvibacter geojedonensis TaxID=1123758 RepID=A0ABW3HYM1_9FLAO
MTNNDILKRLRFTFDYNDAQMVAIFKLADYEVEVEEMTAWLRKDNHPDYLELIDKDLAIFLNGLINEKRGKREGPQPTPEKRLTNNLILKKLKIALNLKTDDIIAVFALVDRKITMPVLNSFLRNPKQDQYRICQDQYLRWFLSGLQAKYRSK